MGEHADEFELELARTGEADDEVRRHVETCETCRERLDAHRDAVRGAVRSLESVDVPAAFDEAVVRMAREQGAAVRRRLHERRRSSTLRRVLPWAAAAGLAAVALAWLAIRQTAPQHAPRTTTGGTQVGGGVEHDTQGRAASPSTGHQPPLDRLGASPATSQRSADDINSDGRIDVLDAYLVALAADRGDDIAALDRNGDGLVDRRDAERIAMAAVTLRRGPDEETTDEHR